MSSVPSTSSLVIWIFLCTISVQTAPAEYEVNENTSKEDLYDIEWQQIEDRYDPRLLSEELENSEMFSEQNKQAEECFVGAIRFRHGEKIPRKNPCEACICVDGETFCWWKQCDSPKKWKAVNKKGKPVITKPSQKTAALSGNPVNSKRLPMNILNFPKNLPVHLSEIDLMIESDGTGKLETTSSSTTVTTTSSPAINLSTPSSDFGSNLSANNSPKSVQNSTMATETTTSSMMGKDSKSGEQKVILDKQGQTENKSKDSEVELEIQSQDKVRKISIDDSSILSKHYIITSSGRIEDIPLASDNVVSQFRNSFINEIMPLNSVEKAVKIDPTQILDAAGQSMDIISSFKSSAPVVQNSTNPTSTSASSNLNSQTTSPPEPVCIVMGQSYKIGMALPQEVGNCLQCVCIEGATVKDSPRVTCSPHNCPPLILPDLFDTTGYGLS